MTNRPQLLSSGITRRITNTRNLLLFLIIGSAAALLFTQSLSGGISTEPFYDDGVYFAASLNLVHGIIPYKDFIFLQPPLITVWLSPFSLLSDITGTRLAFEAARLFTDLIGIIDICLVAYLLRNRPIIRQMLGVGIIAYSENTLWGSLTILIEPYLVALTLCAVIALMDKERITNSRSRMWIAGILFGLAGATKIWAIFPFLTALAIVFWIKPSQSKRLFFGTVLGFLAAVFPFAITVPVRFLKEVVLTQALRGADGLGLESRLQDLSGIPDIYYLKYISSLLAILILLSIYLLAMLLIANSLKTWKLRDGSHLELTASISVILIGISFLLAHSYFSNYGFFMAPFIAITFATISYPFRSMSTGAARRRIQVIATVTIAFLFATFTWQDFNLVKNHGFVSLNNVTSDMSATLGKSGCLWSANPGIAILANRYTGDLAGCPHTVDWGGTELFYVHDYSLAKVKHNAPLQRSFLKWLLESDRLLINPADFGPAEMSYLGSHFHKEHYHQPYGLVKVIYFRNKIN